MWRRKVDLADEFVHESIMSLFVQTDIAYREVVENQSAIGTIGTLSH
jgi:hypothetical protein